MLQNTWQFYRLFTKLYKNAPCVVYYYFKKTHPPSKKPYKNDINNNAVNKKAIKNLAI